MPFDETSRQPGRRPSRNVLGGISTSARSHPMTGFFRNGCCDTGAEDVGMHTVCAVMTAEFLAFSRAAGNDLSTPRPEFGFPGLSPATAGACARRAGRRRWMPAPRRRWCCAPRTRGRSTIARWTTSSGTRSTWPEAWPSDLPAEFALIARHFRPLAGPGSLDLQDDAAVLDPAGRSRIGADRGRDGRGRAFPAR